MPSMWGGIFTSADNVGSSEYRAMVDCIANAVMECDEWQISPDEELSLAQLGDIEGMLGEFEGWAVELERLVDLAIKLAVVEEKAKEVRDG